MPPQAPPTPKKLPAPKTAAGPASRFIKAANQVASGSSSRSSNSSSGRSFRKVPTVRGTFETDMLIELPMAEQVADNALPRCRGNSDMYMPPVKHKRPSRAAPVAPPKRNKKLKQVQNKQMKIEKRMNDMEVSFRETMSFRNIDITTSDLNMCNISMTESDLQKLGDKGAKKAPIVKEISAISMAEPIEGGLSGILLDAKTQLTSGELQWTSQDDLLMKQHFYEGDRLMLSAREQQTMNLPAAISPLCY